MARTPAPPGPPPRHYRPPGAPRARATPALGQPLGTPTPAPQVPENGVSVAGVVAIAIVMLVVGGVVGFFAGRAVEEDDGDQSAPPLTSPSTSETSRPPGDTIPQNPPADPESPPSTDLDPTTIGTLEEPVPLGQAYILGLYEIEVVGLEENAEQTLAEHDPFNPPPPEGRQHLIVEIAVRYTDPEGVGNPGSIPFFVSDGTGEWHDFEASCGQVPGSLLTTGLIDQGDDAVGNVCFTVPAEVVPNLVLGTDGFSGPVYFGIR